MDKKRIWKIMAGVLVVLFCGIFYLSANDRRDGGEVVTESFCDTPASKESTGENLPEKADIQPSAGSAAGGTPSADEASGRVYIHICGEVKKPGVYTFSHDPRVIEVVEKAGGFTRKADQTGINLAVSVTDGAQLVIASKEDKKNPAAAGTGGTSGGGDASGGTGSGDGDGSGGKININQASKEELMKLTGIGEAKANQIITYREEMGKFQKIEDIMNISGIKEGVFNNIKDDITV